MKSLSETEGFFVLTNDLIRTKTKHIRTNCQLLINNYTLLIDSKAYFCSPKYKSWNSNSTSQSVFSI